MGDTVVSGLATPPRTTSTRASAWLARTVASLKTTNRPYHKLKAIHKLQQLIRTDQLSIIRLHGLDLKFRSIELMNGLQTIVLIDSNSSSQ